MKTKTFTLSLLALLAVINSSTAQNRQEDGLPPRGSNFCRAHESMETYYESNPQAKADREALEAFTQEFTKQNYDKTNQKKTAVAKYRIPVVFHVYGGSTHTFWGKTVTKAIVEGAVKSLNEDFNGLNDDYGTVNSAFQSIRSTMDISFELAQKDPKGIATDGIDWKTTTGAGYGNGSGSDTKIAADAWDCKKYMNIYIVADLYNDGVNNNSGVCWYPDATMTTNNTARLVYNGQYLGTNTTKEFASVFTHECGHFLNLAHTFDTGCTGTGDGVTDTPLHKSTTLGCPTSQTSKTPISDCGNWQVNAENYMDYNGAFDCQKMFSKGQTTRMIAALELNNNTRFPLWQSANLIATGLLTPTGIASFDKNIQSVAIYPNPSSGIFQLSMEFISKTNCTIQITDILGRSVFTKEVEGAAGVYTAAIDLTNQSKGIYFVAVNSSQGKQVIKLVVE